MLYILNLVIHSSVDGNSQTVQILITDLYRAFSKANKNFIFPIKFSEHLDHQAERVRTEFSREIIMVKVDGLNDEEELQDFRNLFIWIQEGKLEVILGESGAEGAQRELELVVQQAPEEVKKRFKEGESDDNVYGKFLSFRKLLFNWLINQGYNEMKVRITLNYAVNPNEKSTHAVETLLRSDGRMIKALLNDDRFESLDPYKLRLFEKMKSLLASVAIELKQIIQNDRNNQQDTVDNVLTQASSYLAKLLELIANKTKISKGDYSQIMTPQRGLKSQSFEELLHFIGDKIK